LDRFEILIVDGDTGEVLVNNADSDFGPIPIESLPENAVLQIDTGEKETGKVHS
jgi:hypothetical protein